MKVIVENRIEIEADITIHQVESYLRQTGWTICCKGHLWRSWMKELEDGREVGASVPLREDYEDFAYCLGRTVYEISLAEKRQPGDILIDISKI